MPKRPFLVLPGGMCIPLEGSWRITQLRGDCYILGHNAVVPCGSERSAVSMLAQLAAQTDADVLASEAIHRLERIPESWETDSLEESSLS